MTRPRRPKLKPVRERSAASASRVLPGVPRPGRAAGLLALVLCAATVLVPGAELRAADDPAAAIAGPDVQGRLTKATDLEKKDVKALFTALVALGESPANPAVDAEFLVEYAVRESDRALRLTALWAARKADAKKALEIARKACDAKQRDVTRISLAADAVGLLGTKDDTDVLLPLLSHASELVATAACRALARVGTTKEVEAILDATLKHPEQGVSDQGAWTVQDLLKKPKVAIEKYDKIAASKTDPRALRADATSALLKDAALDPWKYGDSLEASVKALRAAPDTIPVTAIGSEEQAKVQEALDWMQKEMPAAWLLFRATVKKVAAPGPKSDEWMDHGKDELYIPLRFLAQAKRPQHTAYNLFRNAVVLFEKKTGEPWRHARGWQPAIFDLYDLCVIGQLESCGPSGISREIFVKNGLSKTPWSGMVQ
jgi:hypothetical protein